MNLIELIKYLIYIIKIVTFSTVNNKTYFKNWFSIRNTFLSYFNPQQFFFK